MESQASHLPGSGLREVFPPPVPRRGQVWQAGTSRLPAARVERRIATSAHHGGGTAVTVRDEDALGELRETVEQDILDRERILNRAHSVGLTPRQVQLPGRQPRP